MAMLSVVPLRSHATLQILKREDAPIRFTLWCDDLCWWRDAVAEAERLLGFRVTCSRWVPRPLVGYSTVLSPDN